MSLIDIQYIMALRKLIALLQYIGDIIVNHYGTIINHRSPLFQYVVIMAICVPELRKSSRIQVSTDVQTAKRQTARRLHAWCQEQRDTFFVKVFCFNHSVVNSGRGRQLAPYGIFTDPCLVTNQQQKVISLCGHIELLSSLQCSLLENCDHIVRILRSYDL